MNDVFTPWIIGIFIILAALGLSALFVAIIGLQNFLITLILIIGLGVLPYSIGKCITGFFK